MSIEHHTTRRAVLAGTAALPALALAIPAAAETDDPAIDAARRWVEAREAQAAYNTPDGTDWEDDAHAAELDAAEEAGFEEMLNTPPTTAAGLALTLAAFTFAEHGEGIGMRFDRPDNRWGGYLHHRRADLVPAIWSSPAAAELFPKLGRSAAVGAALPARPEDPAVVAYRAWRQAARAHYEFWYASDDLTDDDPEERRLHDADWDARKVLAETVATTPAGIACQIRLAFDLFHDLGAGADPDHPETYEFNHWKDDLDGKVLRNLLAGAERLSGRNPA